MPWSRVDTLAAREQFEVLLASACDHADTLTCDKCADSKGWPREGNTGVYNPNSQQIIAEEVVRMSISYEHGHISTKTFLAVVKDLVGGT